MDTGLNNLALDSGLIPIESCSFCSAFYVCSHIKTGESTDSRDRLNMCLKRFAQSQKDILKASSNLDGPVKVFCASLVDLIDGLSKKLNSIETLKVVDASKYSEFKRPDVCFLIEMMIYFFATNKVCDRLDELLKEKKIINKDSLICQGSANLIRETLSNPVVMNKIKNRVTAEIELFVSEVGV